MPRALALALAIVVATSGCATYEGSRNTAGAGAVAFAASLATTYTANRFRSEPVVLTSLAIGTASMVVVIASGVGMAILPKRVEIAMQIAHRLVVLAEAGDCDTVSRRRHDVEALDGLVYEVVLMQDPAVARCFERSPSAPSSASSPADRERPDPASTSIVR